MVFRGEYDLVSKEDLREDFASLAAAPNVVLDFSGVTYIDSTVIEELMRLRNVRAAAGLAPETLVLHNINLLRIFDVLDLSSVFRIVPALDDVIGRDGNHVVVKYARTQGGS
jgi:anti-anti-sigma regulatory factor